MMAAMDFPETPELLSQCRRSRTPSPAPDEDSEEGMTSRSDSPIQCSICLGKIENMSHTDACDHRYCFTCLLEWSKVNNVCPLCKQRFKSIIHTIQSENNFESYTLPERPPQPRHDFDVEFLGYEETLRSSYEHIGQILMQRLREGIPEAVTGLRRPLSFVRYSTGRSRSRLASSDFRRTIYENNLYVQPESILDSLTGRYRESSPAWYRANLAQTHRLVPWLNRELNALGTVQPHHIPHVLQLILEFVQQYPILSPDFRMAMEPLVGNRTAHFQHEFYNFARSVYDMVGYDREASYGPHPHPHQQTEHETLEVSSDENDEQEEHSSVIVVDDNAPSTFQPSTSNGINAGNRDNKAPILINSSAEEDEIEIVDQVHGISNGTTSPVVIDIETSDGEEDHVVDETEFDSNWSGFSSIDSFYQSTSCRRQRRRWRRRRRQRQRQSEAEGTSAPQSEIFEEAESPRRCKGKGKGKSSKRPVPDTEQAGSSSNLPAPDSVDVGSSPEHLKAKKRSKRKNRKPKDIKTELSHLRGSDDEYDTAEDRPLIKLTKRRKKATSECSRHRRVPNLRRGSSKDVDSNQWQLGNVGMVTEFGKATGPHLVDPSKPTSCTKSKRDASWPDEEDDGNQAHPSNFETAALKAPEPIATHFVDPSKPTSSLMSTRVVSLVPVNSKSEKPACDKKRKSKKKKRRRDDSASEEEVRRSDRKKRKKKSKEKQKEWKSKRSDKLKAANEIIKDEDNEVDLRVRLNSLKRKVILESSDSADEPFSFQL